jgi:hypothetical protein
MARIMEKRSMKPNHPGRKKEDRGKAARGRKKEDRGKAARG